MVNITIYSTPTCHWCNKAKEFFEENDVNFEEIDVSKDRSKAQEMIEKSGQMGVPVIKIGDEIIVGFDKAKITSLLKL